jgi:3-oxoacyl-ACP reductase-like protein
MSLFDTLKNAIFGHAKSAAPAAPAAPTAAPKPSATTTAAPPPSSAPPQQPVDVEAVLNGLNAKSPQKLNWQSSIVDLMKLVGMDSSLQHRKELAAELGYKGDTNDSATMNVWLHKAVMQKLAANGGKVPDSLKN